MKYCHYCGKQMPDDSIFCPACGKRLYTQQQGDQPEQQPQELEEEQEKKQSSLWGFTIVVLIITLIAAAVVYFYNTFAGESALAPKDDIQQVDTAVTQPQEDPEEEMSEEDELSQAEFDLRKRVQKMYNDALYMDGDASYTGRYCSASLRNLILKADAVSSSWLDCNVWTFSKETEHPQIEQIQVKSYNPMQSVVKIAVRPKVNADIVNIVTLRLVKEDGAWLIDDFEKDGRSVRNMAEHALVVDEVRREIFADTVM